MILEVSSIDHCGVDDTGVTVALSISQLIVFNAVKHIRKSSEISTSTATVIKTRHNPTQETPLPLYLSMMLHSETRK